MTLFGKDQIALVTGGTSGIGLALVEALRDRGARVLFCARTAGAVAAVEARLPGTKGYVCDVTDAAALGAMATEIEASFGRLDLAVANAGALRNLDFMAAPQGPEDLEADIALNLTSVLLTINALLPLLRRSQAAHIVAVGSGYGWSPIARAPIYSAAKAGVRAFVKALRAQLAPSGIHVMEVVPPAVDTPAVAHVPGRKLAPSDLARAILHGLDRRRPEVFAGQTRMIPLMMRLAPGALERMTLGG